MLSPRYYGGLMDPLEYNILVKLHTSAVESRRDSVIRNIRWRNRTLERDDLGYFYRTPISRETSVERTTVETIRRVPDLYYWRDVVEYPKFLRRLNDTHITVGHNGRLDVRVSGYPKVDVQWYKDWRPIFSSSKVQIHQYDPNEHVLVINNATVDDQGLYSVRISNEAGSVHSSAFVHVDKSRSLCDTIRRSFYDNVYDL